MQAAAAAILLLQGTLYVTDDERIWLSSERSRRPEGVLMISRTSRFLIRSRTCGRPSWILNTRCTGMPLLAMARAVPLVAISFRPRLCSRAA